MLKLISELKQGDAFVEFLEGGSQWRMRTSGLDGKAECIDSGDGVFRLGEVSDFSPNVVCSVEPGVSEDFKNQLTQRIAILNKAHIQESDVCVDMASALAEERLYILDPINGATDPHRFVVIAPHSMERFHQVSTIDAWIVDELGHKASRSHPKPIPVHKVDFSDLYYATKRDQIMINSLYGSDAALKKRHRTATSSSPADSQANQLRDSLSVSSVGAIHQQTQSLLDALREATNQVQYLKPESFDDNAHKNEFSEQLKRWTDLSKKVEATLDAGLPAESGAEKLERFNRELLDSVETLGGIAEQYGVRTLADLMYLQMAILHDGHIEVWGEQTNALEVLKGLPSADEWINRYTTEIDASDDVSRSAVKPAPVSNAMTHPIIGRTDPAVLPNPERQVRLLQCLANGRMGACSFNSSGRAGEMTWDLEVQHDESSPTELARFYLLQDGLPIESVDLSGDAWRSFESEGIDEPSFVMAILNGQSLEAAFEAEGVVLLGSDTLFGPGDIPAIVTGIASTPRKLTFKEEVVVANGLPLGGEFASYIGKAMACADSTNKQILTNAFWDLFSKVLADANEAPAKPSSKSAAEPSSMDR